MGTLIYLEQRRQPATSNAATTGDLDLIGPLVVVWLGSVVRVGLAFAHREVFQTEASLALLCMILLPLAAVRASRCRE